MAWCATSAARSAPSSVGRLKCEEITRYKPPVEIELMRRIKRALDPDNIMNPGKVVRVRP
jgi:FAD/FMN-containing dehydrogenase